MAPSGPDRRAALLREIRSLAEGATTDTLAPLFSTEQVALLFGVSERTIRVWANKNWIPAIRIPSGHWKFPAQEIARVYQIGLQQGQSLSNTRSKRVETDKETLLIDG